MKKICILLGIFLLFNSTCWAEKNNACTTGKTAVILQVLDNGALAHICPPFNFLEENPILSCRLKGTLVHFNYNDNYVDDQVIELHRGQCFAEGGAYKYQNKNGDIKTVRDISIMYSKY